MRDRLIELLGNFPTFGERTLKDKWMPEAIERLASHLLAEGVIVPPCKVGSDVCFADYENKSVWGGELVSFSLDAAHLWFNCHYKCGLNIWHPIEDFGKTVFLTYAEAEKALAERREELK
jgi:hypothetical protein